MIVIVCGILLAYFLINIFENMKNPLGLSNEERRKYLPSNEDEENFLVSKEKTKKMMQDFYGENDIRCKLN